MGKIVVTVPASQANANEDKEVLARLLEAHPKLTRLDLTHQFSGGYSACRVYLGQATFAAPAPRRWIVKLGPATEIKAEAAGLALAKGHVASGNLASQIIHEHDDNYGVLIQDFAHHDHAKRPLDLEGALKRAYGIEATGAVVRTVANWIGEPRWQKCNVSEVLRSWSVAKIARLPEHLAATADSPVIYSPDYGEAYGNPAYHIPRQLRSREVECPFAFTHGDLNLRNVVFGWNDQGALNHDSPVFIDFRFAGDEQWSIVDLAKLEACLRYTRVRVRDDYDLLKQMSALLSSSRRSLELSALPDICSDKEIQETWRCIKLIRDAVGEHLASRPDAELAYWACLAAYAISACTYPQLHATSHNLAYIDAAAILTDRILGTSGTPQQTLPLHTKFSPRVEPTPRKTGAKPSQVSALCAGIAQGRAVLVVGQDYGRAGGVDPFSAFAQHLYEDVTGAAAPSPSVAVNLESLARKASRTTIQKKVKVRFSACSQDKQSAALNHPWAVVVNCHMHDLPLQLLGDEYVRVESVDDAVAHTDAVATGQRVYFPLSGDIWSKPHDLVLTNADRRRRDQALEAVVRALGARQVPLSLVFWRCEEFPVEQMSALRDVFAEGVHASVDCFFVSKQHDDTRDSALSALDIPRIDASLHELLSGLEDDTQRAAPGYQPKWYGDDGRTIPLPDVFAQTGRLIGYFEGSLYPAWDTDADDLNYLRGAPPTSDDLDAGRIVRRQIMTTTLLPAIENSLRDADSDARVVVLSGRAGAGVTSLLFYCAHELASRGDNPVLVLNPNAAASRAAWIRAGELVAEVSHATNSAVLVFADAQEHTFDDVGLLLQGASDKNGRVVPVIGGRRETMRQSLRGKKKEQFADIHEIPDTLTEDEWRSLAQVLKRNGFSADRDFEDLVQALVAADRLIPAIYEATDRQNRKFREIVEYEFALYGRDAVVQKAYRLICTLSAFGLSMTQFWLLSALGGRGFREATRIL